MDRLTTRFSNGTAGLIMSKMPRLAPYANAITRLAAYEDTGLEPKDVEDLRGRLKENIGMATLWADRYYDLLAARQNTTTQHIADLLQAESEGRLIVLPCKVGDTVYNLDNDERGEPVDYTGRICIGGNAGYLVLSSLYNDVEDADSLCYANYIEWAENEMLASEICVWPISQCYFTREEAEASLGGDHDV